MSRAEAFVARPEARPAGATSPSSVSAGPQPYPPGLRQVWALHPQFADRVVAALVIGLEIVSVAVRKHVGLDTGPLALVVTGLVLSAAGLLLRRQHPRIGFVIVAVGSVPLATEPTGVGVLALAVALFALAAYESPRAGWIGCAALVVAIEVVLLIKFALQLTPPRTGSQLAQLASTHGEMIPLTLTLLVATLLGVNAGHRKRYIAALLEHAAQLARERDQQARLATAAERSRIAREIHDIVAHSLSVMVRLADGAETVLVSDPASARRVLDQIGTTGRSSLTEMRRVLGVLQDGEEPVELDPPPAVHDLVALIDVYRQAGLPVTYRLTGDPPASAGVQLAVFRAVQEMLTNALRHAVSPQRVELDIDFSAGVTLTATNDDAVAPRPPAPSCPGRGLIGMRERAALYGGIVTSGPNGDSGWRVQMTLPDAGRDT